MNYFIRPIFLSITFMAVFHACLPTLEAEPVTLDPWTSTATGQPLTRVEIAPEGSDPAAKLPTVIYLQNLSSPRVGREADESVIQSFLNDGMLVITMDYGNHDHARLPFINRDFVTLRNDILADDSAIAAGNPDPGNFSTVREMDSARIFIVPEGCRLEQNVTYEGIRGMDIIYPSDPVLPVGAVLQFSADNANRMGNFSMAVTHDSILPALAAEGFAAAMADHPVSGGYNGIDYMPMSAWSVQAAIQALRAQRDTLPLNGRIATLGFSRGSGVALMGVTTTDVEEWTIYSRRGEDTIVQDSEVNVGPYPQEDASVQGAVIMSGRFTYIDLLPTDGKAAPGGLYTLTWGPIEDNYDAWRDAGALDYLHEDPGIPLFMTINKDDEHAHHQMDVLRNRLTELGVDFIFMEDTEEEKAHRMPLVHDILNAMNRYLKEALMDPDPYTGVSELRPALQLLPDNRIHWSSALALPPADYRLEVSTDFANWTRAATIRPATNGGFLFEWDMPDVPETFLVRLLPPE